MKTQIVINNQIVELICKPLIGSNFTCAAEGLQHIRLMLESGSFDGFVDCDAIVDCENVGSYTITWKSIEKRAFLVSIHGKDVSLAVHKKLIEKMDDETFMQIAEREGTVYTLQGFTKAHNQSDIILSMFYIRFI